MSDPTSTPTAHSAGAPGGEAPGGEGQSSDPLEKKVDRLTKMVRSLLHGRSEIPPAKKYTYAEAAFRLQHGTTWAQVPEGRREAMQREALSADVVGQLARDGDCPLRRVKVGGSTYVTERSIQHYEEGIRRGWIDGYQVKRPREKAQ